jgi:aryl-alcohol dehydrogenase-like predicted oxidoreductase
LFSPVAEERLRSLLACIQERYRPAGSPGNPLAKISGEANHLTLQLRLAAVTVGRTKYGPRRIYQTAARAYNATPSQISIAWLIARPSVTGPIASATSVEQLRDLIAAARLELDAATIAALDDASA